MDRLVVEYLANALWQIPLLVAGVGALLWALGSDVQTRHRVWLGVLAVAVLMPLRGMEMGPKITVFTPPPAEMSVHSSASGSAMPISEEPAAEEPAMVAYDKLPATKSGLTLGPAATRWLIRLYLGALLFAGWRILRAWFAAQGLLRRSRSIHLAPRAMAIFAQAADRQRIRLPRLRQSDETVSPVVIGAWRPVLLLPAGFDHLKDDEILAALSHEFAHLARRDYLVNLICQIAALPIAWHPATFVVQKRIRDTREMLCDAVAADEMASPVRYATCLVAFAFRALDNRQGALATQGMTMFDNSTLEERILQLTQEPERPEPRIRLARLAGASLGLVLSVTLALLVHITPTLADTTDPETSAPVQLTPPAELPAAPAAPVPAPAASAPAVVIHHHATPGSDEIQRGIAEEKRQQADQQRHQADLQRQAADRQREEANRQREAADRQRQEFDRQRQLADRQREEADRQREQAQAQREAAREKAEAEREAAQEQREAAREAADAQREAAREAAQAAREAADEARRGADDLRRQIAEAIKANEAAREIDMEAIRKQVRETTANVNGPEFKEQMAELQAHMKELHDHMAELRDRMKEINKEMEKSLNTPM